MAQVLREYGLGMEILARALKNLKIVAMDGEIGKLDDFYFDDERFVCTHFSVRFRDHLKSNIVIMPIKLISMIEFEKKVVLIDTHSPHVRRGPRIVRNREVSSEYIKQYWSDFFNVPDRGHGVEFFGPFVQPEELIQSNPATREENLVPSRTLYPLQALIGLTAEAVDGRAGRIKGTLVNVENWAIHSLVVKKGLRPFQKRSAVHLSFVRKIRWADHAVDIELPIDAVYNGLDFEPSEPCTEIQKLVKIDYLGTVVPAEKKYKAVIANK